MMMIKIHLASSIWSPAGNMSAARKAPKERPKSAQKTARRGPEAVRKPPSRRLKATLLGPPFAAQKRLTVAIRRLLGHAARRSLQECLSKSAPQKLAKRLPEKSGQKGRPLLINATRCF